MNSLCNFRLQLFAWNIGTYWLLYSAKIISPFPESGTRCSYSFCSLYDEKVVGILWKVFVFFPLTLFFPVSHSSFLSFSLHLPISLPSPLSMDRDIPNHYSEGYKALKSMHYVYVRFILLNSIAWTQKLAMLTISLSWSPRFYQKE